MVRASPVFAWVVFARMTRLLTMSSGSCRTLIRKSSCRRSPSHIAGCFLPMLGGQMDDNERRRVMARQDYEALRAGGTV